MNSTARTESGAVTFANSEDALKKPGTVGKIAPGAELRFIGEDGKVLPQGEIGEIYSRIAGNPDFTYHNKPEKRAEIDRDGFITSGDVGYIDEDGYVFICDRKRDMVISGGVNIYPAEIEAALHAVPGVHDCAVFGIPDDEFGEALMAVVEPQPGVTLDVADIRAQLKTSLADYKVPKHVEIHDNLPREDSGKIFKRRLRDPYWERAGGGFEAAPRDEDTARMARLLLDLAPRPKNCDLKGVPGSFWSISPCHPRSCLPTPSCGPIAPRKLWRSKKMPGCATTSGCSGVSSATPCATRKAPTCSTWSSASGRPRSGSTAMTTGRRGASSKSSSTACRPARPCASCAPSAIFRTSPISPRTRTTSGRCGRAPPPAERRARERWR